VENLQILRTFHVHICKDEHLNNQFIYFNLPGEHVNCDTFPKIG